MQTYDELVVSLKNSGIPFAETAWMQAPVGDYGTVMLDSAPVSLFADNKLIFQQFSGTVDLWSVDSGRTSAETIQGVLNDAGISWQVARIEYLNGLNFTHWQWRITCGGVL